MGHWSNIDPKIVKFICYVLFNNNNTIVDVETKMLGFRGIHSYNVL